MPSRNGQGTFTELSSSGLKAWGGRIHEEFLPELKGPKAVRAYREMRDNDAIIGAILFAIEMRIRQLEWWDEPADDSDEAKKAAEFATSCRADMSETWEDTISEVLSMLVYGWSFLELVYKRREGENPDDPSRHSTYDDGYIGWRKLPLVPQDTLDRWEFSDDESLDGIHQRTDKGAFYVPIEKGLLFRTQVRKRNPEGRSILRNAWRSWYLKRRIENIEGVGIDRDLAGLPMIKAPEDVPIFDSGREDMVALRNEAERIVQNIRRDEQEGVLLPFGWEFELMSTGGRRQFDTGQIIERYDRRMAMVALQDAILLGHEHVGSYALADAKTDMGALALIAWPDMITAVFNNYAYPRLFALNPFSPDVIPELKHGDLEQRDIAAFSDALSKLVPLGFITPQEDDEAFVRDMFGMPPKPELTPEEEAAKQAEEQAALAAQQAQQAVVDGNGQVPGQAPGHSPLANTTVGKLFDESKHPRDEHGHFIDTPGSGDVPSLDAASTAEEAEQWARDAYPDIEWDLKGGDPRVLKPTLKQFDKLAKDYPDAAARIGVVRIERPTSGKDIPYIAAANLGEKMGDKNFPNEIYFNGELYGNADKLKNLLGEKVKEKFIHKGSSEPEAIITHEFGHVLDSYLSSLNDQRATRYKNLDAGIGSVARLQGAFKKSNKPTRKLSGYATVNSDEGFAEGFGAIYHHPNPASIPYVQKQKALLDAVSPKNLRPDDNVQWYDAPPHEREAAQRETLDLKERLGLK